MRKAPLATAGTLALLLASNAAAATITLNGTDGLWSDLVTTAPGGTPSINNASNPREARFGTDAGNGLSGYLFTPVTGPAVVTVDGPAFLLGTFVHDNRAMFGPSLATINLNFSLDWQDFLPDVAGPFAFTHDETPNGIPPDFTDVPVCPYGGNNGQGVNINGCADAVSIASPFLNQMISFGGDTYFFSLLGFSTDGGLTTTSTFVTQEQAFNVAGLYGTVTSVPITLETVPEPASVLLLGAGLAGLAIRLRRRRT